MKVKLPKFISDNIVLKITSLNAIVIGMRLVVSLFVTRLIALTFGEAGIASIGQVRNIMAMLTSTTTLGTFNGVVKYVAEFKENRSELSKLFSTATVFISVGSFISAAVLYFGANYLSINVFSSKSYVYVFQLLAVIVPFIAVNRLISGMLNGLSEYKKYAKIELISYLLATIAIVYGLYNYDLKGVIIAIAIAPIIQLGVLLLVFGKTVKQYLKFKELSLNLDYKSKLLAFTLMSLVSTFLINYIELDIRILVTDEININEAGYWTAMTSVSKNYMVFATGLFTLYVLPKFSGIYDKIGFVKELRNIYKSILPVFAMGMLLVYVLRNLIIDWMFPGFTGMESLFKWQLLGDFIRLCSLVLSYQFLAKRQVKSFVLTELISLALFYMLTKFFIQGYGTEGVVIAHFVRYVIYFILVAVIVGYNFKNSNAQSS